MSTVDLTHKVRVSLAKNGIAHPSMDNIVDALIRTGGQEPATAHRHGHAQLVDQARLVQRELSGLGPLVDALMDPQVTDVLLNPNGDVWCDRGEGMELFAPRVCTAEEGRAIAVRLAARCGVRLDDAWPFADGVLSELPCGVVADALRIHAVLAPPADGGCCISLRVLRQSGWSLEDMVGSGLCDAEMATVLKQVVRRRKNILISGGTGAGKTTLLATLLGQVGEKERIIVVEDTPELMPQHSNVVKMHTRRDNADGSGAISMRQLVMQCLRMRPDRVIVGEVRGEEIADLLVALNTGHNGSAGTIHANSAQAVPGRLLALGAMASLPPDVIAHHVIDGVDLLLHVEKTPAGRKLVHIARFRGLHREHGHTHNNEPSTRHSGGRGEELGIELLWDNGPTSAWKSFVQSLKIQPHAQATKTS